MSTMGKEPAITDPEVSNAMAQMMMCEKPPMSLTITDEEMVFLDRVHQVWCTVGEVKRAKTIGRLSAALAVFIAVNLMAYILFWRGYVSTGSWGLGYLPNSVQLVVEVAWGMLAGASLAVVVLAVLALFAARRRGGRIALAEFLVGRLYEHRTGSETSPEWRSQLDHRDLWDVSAALRFPPSVGA